MENWIESYSKLIEQALSQLGIDPKTARSEEAEQRWYLHRDQTNVMLLLRESELYNKEKKPVVVLAAPLVRIPKDEKVKAKVFEYMLSINHVSISESFSVNEGVIYMRSSSYAASLNADTLKALIDNFTFWAQYFHKEFVAELEEGEKNKEATKK